ncbi:MAG TPA: CdaR family protein [Levilinea sp.]|nr:CdaR family protein [Levilinea sp.]
MNFLRTILRQLPTLLLALTLSITVWISAATAADPVTQRLFGAVPIELIGQDPGLLLVSDSPTQARVTLVGLASVLDRLAAGQSPVRAVVDLSGLEVGMHTVPVQISVISPHLANVVEQSPQTIQVELEAIASQTYPIRLIQRGEVAVGFQAETPVIDQRTVTITGPQSAVARVEEVRAILDLNRATESIERPLTLIAVDAAEVIVTGINISPSQVMMRLAISQRGGYRNVVVRVVVAGQVARGYRVTNISVFPPAVTVFSPDPSLVEGLPGYVDTAPLDLDNASDDINLFLPLDLPPGVSVVGQEGAIADQFVEVQVGVAAIVGSLTITDVPVDIVGLAEGLRATISPESVAVILSGPLPVLELLAAQDVRVIVDVTGENVGTYQLVPEVVFQNDDLQVDSILPGSVQVTITLAPRIDLRITVTPTATLSP